MKRARLKISVYNYSSYQAFLQDAYTDLNSQDSNYSYRYLQKKAGYSVSSNHFWQVATGRAKLSQQAAQRYARALGLSAKEAQFFFLLAAMNQAKNDNDRNYYLDQLKQFPAFRNSKNYGLLRYEFYSEWYLPALRELVALKNFREDSEWISNQLKPSVTPKQVREGLKKLESIGYLVRDENGHLQQSAPQIGGYGDRSDSDDVAKLAIRNFHRLMIQLGADAIDTHEQSQRYVIGSTMAISRNQAEHLRPMIEEFMQQVDRHVAEDEPIETVYRLNVQLFPLVKTGKDKG